MLEVIGINILIYKYILSKSIDIRVDQVWGLEGKMFYLFKGIGRIFQLLRIPIINMYRNPH